MVTDVVDRVTDFGSVNENAIAPTHYATGLKFLHFGQVSGPYAINMREKLFLPNRSTLKSGLVHSYWVPQSRHSLRTCQRDSQASAPVVIGTVPVLHQRPK